MNLGFHQTADAEGTYERMKNKVAEELKQHFRPEFLNRVDEIIVFPPLTQEQIIHMVDNMIASVELRLKDRDMSLELTTAAKDLLADARASTRCWGRVRCGAPCSARSRTCWPRRCSTARSDPVRSCSWTSTASRRRPRSSPSPAPRSRELPDLPPIDEALPGTEEATAAT